MWWHCNDFYSGWCKYTKRKKIHSMMVQFFLSFLIDYVAAWSRAVAVSTVASRRKLDVMVA